MSVMKALVGVASSHDTIAVRRGGLPPKNIQLHWKPDFGVGLHLVVTAAYDQYAS